MHSIGKMEVDVLENQNRYHHYFVENEELRMFGALALLWFKPISFDVLQSILNSQVD